MSIFQAIAAILGISAAPSVAAPTVAWPDLPSSGFIVGRAATIQDAKAGNAVYSQEWTGLGAIPIQIPQYTYWTDENGIKKPMILVQAEKSSDGTENVGLRGLDGSETVATLPEVELLGTTKPKQ